MVRKVKYSCSLNAIIKGDFHAQTTNFQTIGAIDSSKYTLNSGVPDSTWDYNPPSTS